MADEEKAGKRFWERIVQSVPIPFSVIDVNTHCIVAANAAYLHGASLGRACYEVSHQSPAPCQGERHPCPLEIVKTTGREVRVEHIHQSLHGGERIVDVYGYPVFDEEGRLAHMIEFAVDITECKEALVKLDAKNEELRQTCAKLQSAQQQLVHQEKLAIIGQLAAGVAHEINNPVGFITSNLGTMRRHVETLHGAMDLLLAEVSPDRRAEIETMLQRRKIAFIRQDVGDILDECGQGLDRINRIVRGLKNFSRHDQEQLEEADLNGCLEETLNMVWNELKYKARVVKEFGELPRVLCMPGLLEQVFVNLLVNAAQAMEQEGQITLRTWLREQDVFVAISDTGCGIPADRLERIFMPFFTTKAAGKGTGLGLSISREIVQRHGGTIAVESEEGKGTTFLVQLPLRSPVEAALAPGL
jgi:signal transduction histidine kinase